MKNPQMAKLPQAPVFIKTVYSLILGTLFTMLFSCTKDLSDQTDMTKIHSKMKHPTGQDNASYAVSQNGRTIKVDPNKLLESAKNGTLLTLNEGECNCEYEVLDLEFVNPSGYPKNSARIFAEEYCIDPSSCHLFFGDYESSCDHTSTIPCVDTFSSKHVDFPFNCQPIPAFSTFKTTFFSKAKTTDCSGLTNHEFAKIKFQIHCAGIYYGNDGCVVEGEPIGQTIYSSEVFIIELNNQTHETINIQLDGCGCLPIEAYEPG